MGPPRSAAPKSLSKVLQRVEAETAASEGASGLIPQLRPVLAVCVACSNIPLPHACVPVLAPKRSVLPQFSSRRSGQRRWPEARQKATRRMQPDQVHTQLLRRGLLQLPPPHSWVSVSPCACLMAYRTAQSSPGTVWHGSSAEKPLVPLGHHPRLQLCAGHIAICATVSYGQNIHTYTSGCRQGGEAGVHGRAAAQPVGGHQGQVAGPGIPQQDPGRAAEPGVPGSSGRLAAGARPWTLLRS